MNRMSYKEIININYKLIFEYFDTPLSFIGESKKRNYLFYYINDETFFVSELRKKDVGQLNIQKNLTDFMSYLVDENKVNIVKFDFSNDTVAYQSLDDATFEVEKYLPSSKKVIDYDYNLEIEIPFEFDYLSTLNFPLETDNMTVRIADEFNSHVYSFDLIENVMSYVKKSFDSVKSAASTAGQVINQDLMMSPPTEGSFKINFLTSNNNGLLDDKIDFFPILNTINEVTVESRELNLEIINDKVGIELIENINELYNFAKDKGVVVEFYENPMSDNQLAKISSNGILENNLRVFKDEILEKEKLVVNYQNLEIAETRFVSGSILYNSVKIEKEGSAVKAKFEPSLFKKIKRKTQHLTLDQSIHVELIIETTVDAKQDVVTETLIITSFWYN